MTCAYIHGYSLAERARLIEQARTLAPAVFGGLSFADGETLLELGCGVGAQTKQILRRWPRANVVALDRNPGYLAAAADCLREEIAARKARLVGADAESLPFGPDSFDAVITVWVLEHVSRPGRILAEAIRVLKPGGRVILTEVDNGTFRVCPDNPIVEEWWSKFNRLQGQSGADPFIGRSLGQLARECGLTQIATEPRYVVSTKREPERRLELVRYVRDLFLSGAENLKRASYIDDTDTENLKAEFARLEARPEADIEYVAVRLSAMKPPNSNEV